MCVVDDCSHPHPYPLACMWCGLHGGWCVLSHTPPLHVIPPPPPCVVVCSPDMTTCTPLWVVWEKRKPTTPIAFLVVSPLFVVGGCVHYYGVW